MKPAIDYSLYLITDRALMSTPTLEQAVESAIKGGCSLVQLREKHADSLSFYKTARQMRLLCRQHSVPLIINDRVDIALAVDADGVHVGQTDIPASVVRHLIGGDKILGVSASTLEQAEKAEQAGADYLGVGAMFATNTKTDANLTGMHTLAQIRAKTSLPIVVIGGINKKTIPLFKGCGINGIAVVSALLAQRDIRQAAEKLKELFAATKEN